MADPSKKRRVRELQTEIRDLVKLAKNAEGKGAFAAAVTARSRLATMRADLDRLRDEMAAEAEKDPIVRIRRLRRRASEDGSYVAAAALLKQEEEIEAQARARQEEEAKARRAAMTEEDFLRSLCAKIQAMPPSMQMRIRERLGW